LVEDLRNFIDVLDKQKVLVRMNREVNWKYDIGKISRLNNNPILFENIMDYPGFQVVTNALCDYSKIALALNLDTSISVNQLHSIFRQRVSHTIDPKIVSKGPVEENKIKENNVNLFMLPVPWWSRADGGRYIGTWHINVSKDPETGRRNLGVYRMMVLDSNHTTVSVSPDSHLDYHIQKARIYGKPLEMSVAIGVSEVLIIAASCAFPLDIDEYCKAGALCNSPVELVRCRTVDLEVPADSEIVIEGVIDPNIRVTDGPFLDYAGITNTNHNAYRFEVTCIMHRNNPIFRGAAVGRPGAEDHVLFSFLSQFGLVDFHGSRLRQKVQNFLLKRRAYRTFQLTGRASQLFKSILRS